MANSPYVFDASAENFPRLVLENSAKGPVVVNYWSPRAGPCLMLMPRLVHLAGEFGGRFLLVMLNTDEFGPLARLHGVMSLPTIKLYRHGKVMDTLHGAESEGVLRDFILKHLVVTTPADMQAPQSPLDLAKQMVLQGRYAQADDLLQALPAEAHEIPELGKLAAHVSILRTAHEAPPAAELEQAIAADPGNLEARYRLSAVQLVANNYDAAMQQLLEIARRDRGFRRDVGHNGLLALFELLGDEDERVIRFHALLQETMH